MVPCLLDLCASAATGLLSQVPASELGACQNSHQPIPTLGAPTMGCGAPLGTHPQHVQPMTFGHGITGRLGWVLMPPMLLVYLHPRCFHRRVGSAHGISPRASPATPTGTKTFARGHATPLGLNMLLVLRAMGNKHVYIMQDQVNNMHGKSVLHHY